MINKEDLLVTLIDKLMNSNNQVNTWNNQVNTLSNQVTTWNNQVNTWNNITDSILIWKYIILRARNAWVHFWKLVYENNWFYRLEKSRRLYYWETANKWISLSEVAEFWITDKSKVCKELEIIEITEKEWWEIIPCTDIAIKSIQDKKDFIYN